jgi:hypothetical protein
MAAFVLAAWPQSVSAQNLGSDARLIGLGGAGATDNIASKIMEDQQPYRVIPIPVGIFQLINNRKFFNPNDPEFNPARAIEYAADPMHMTLGRNSDSFGNRFVNDLVTGNFTSTRDLNTYRGFTPASEITANGLIAPSWGTTLPVVRNEATGSTHGVFVGAGPYMSLGTGLNFDQNLISILSSTTDVYMPNSTFLIGNTTMGQAAVAITGGYRGKFPLLGALQSFSGGSRDGIHVAANYHYLHGIHYDTADLQLQLETDNAGLLTLTPASTPIVVNRTMSGSGRGFAIDMATVVVMGPWNFGGGIDGIANRIDWNDLSSRQYRLEAAELYNGGGFVTTQLPAPTGSRRVSLPQRYAGHGGYKTERWAAVAEMTRGLDKKVGVGGGAEYTFGPFVLRGGTRYSRKLWHGATGVGLNITKGFGIDAAAFQTSTNLEQDRKMSFAFSLRLTRND